MMNDRAEMLKTIKLTRAKAEALFRQGKHIEADRLMAEADKLVERLGGGS